MPQRISPHPSLRVAPRRATTLRIGAALLTALVAACGGRHRARQAPAPVETPLTAPDPRVERLAAPDTFDVRFETSRGPMTVRFVRNWGPHGVDRLYYLVRNGFYDDVRFFRVLPHYIAQFGASGDPRVNRVWEVRTVPDDAVRRSNMRGFVSFAMAGKNTRTTQLFVNLSNNQRLDRLGFSPVGRVIDGMAAADSLYAGYGEGPPAGKGPDQDRLAAEGNRYLEREFPKLDYVRSARVVRTANAGAPKP